MDKKIRAYTGKMINDLTGKVFKKLTVLAYDEEGHKLRKTPVWICKCDCGNKTNVIATSLNAKTSTSCGYCGEKLIPGTNIIDLSGKRFGRLTALKYDIQAHKKKKRVYWICKCDCGNVKSIQRSALMQRLTTTCNHCKINLGEFNTFKTVMGIEAINLVGKKFGALSVECYSEEMHKKKNQIMWRCKCDCGNTTFVSSSALFGTTKTCGCGIKDIDNKYVKTIHNKLVKDLSGIKYNKLLILGYDSEQHKTTGRLKWKCKCDCGKIVHLTSSDIKSAKSCGCAKLETGKKRIKDLKGEKYGKLNVLKYDKVISHKRGRSVWKCQCECGNKSYVAGNDLTSGNTKSCGCSRKDIAKNKIINRIGKTYGKLQVTAYDEEKHKITGSVYWKCKCECGNETSVESSRLQTGNTKSCGKCGKIFVVGTNVEDLSKQKFNMLQPISYTIFPTNPRTIKWKCLCDCGNYTEVNAGHLKSGNTKSCGCLTKRSNYKDITNKKFNSLTALCLDKKMTNEKGTAHWFCKCDCGNLKYVSLSALKSNNTKTCGNCNNRKHLKGTRIVDLTDETFGRLKVISIIKSSVNKGKIKWLCECECGNKIETTRDLLTNGNTKSCGCLKKDLNSSFIDLTAKVFNKLTVVSYNEEESKRVRDKKGSTKIAWNCLCECGNHTVVVTGDLQGNHILSCGCAKIDAGKKRRQKLQGRKFGKLTVLYYDEEIRDQKWTCKCECGSITRVLSYDLKSKKVHSCGCATTSIIQQETIKYLNYLGYDVKHEKNCSIKIKNIIIPPAGEGVIRTTSYLYFDNEIVLADKHILIEVDGIQHFSITNFSQMAAKVYRTSPEEELKYQQDRDKLKDEYIKYLDNYYLIRLPYTLFDRSDSYKKVLLTEIERIKQLPLKK